MQIRKVTPLGDTVLIGPLKQTTVSDGGIHLVERYQDDAKQWVILAVGPGYTTKLGVLVAPEVKVGDRVIFNPQLPNGVKHVFEDGSRWTIVETSRLEMVW